ncbi:unnamed protein product [Meganyctiphanes norvegica]|uniref:Uncharacterized protein n=1 Tax=Meganyctiphanes norvegica TaxID=48144 RepID=A0AAV2QPR2_MEGNR
MLDYEELWLLNLVRQSPSGQLSYPIDGRSMMWYILSTSQHPYSIPGRHLICYPQQNNQQLSEFLYHMGKSPADQHALEKMLTRLYDRGFPYQTVQQSKGLWLAC